MGGGNGCADTSGLFGVMVRGDSSISTSLFMDFVFKFLEIYYHLSSVGEAQMLHPGGQSLKSSVYCS